MKPRIGFDKKAVGRFFLEHSEKVLLGAFILAFAAIIYGAVLRREKFDKTPQDLLDNVAKAKRSLEGERRDKLNELRKELQDRDDKGDYKNEADKIAKFIRQGISVKPYECDVALDKPLFGQRGKREQPEIFGVEDLRASADFGAFQVMETGAGGPAAPPAATPRGGGRIGQPGGRFTAVSGVSIKGKHWVVVTGLVPLAKQANAYRKALGDSVAYDPASDVPAYVDYVVERAEINSPADEKNPPFKKLCSAVEYKEEAAKDWPPAQAEVVEPKYTDPILTFPLGPLQNRTWGKSAAHDPEIPYILGDAAAGGAADADNTGDRANPPNRGMVDYRGMQGRQYNRGQVFTTESADYKLLRFFDFSAEPGKSYIYRVSLTLKNPNYGIDAAKLQKADFAKEKNLYTNLPANDQTVAKSNRVDVPKDTQILVGAAKADDLAPDKFPVILLSWAQKIGRAGYFSVLNVERGQVLNFLNEKIIPEALDSPGPPSTDAEDTRTDLITDTALLDRDGGKKFTIGKDRKSTVPREMLFMAVNGTSIVLMHRGELDDMSEVNRVTTKPETPAGTDRRGRPVPGAVDPRTLIHGG